MDAGKRHLLFVTGMHRSGTSALCAALQAAGASFGDHLMEAMEGVNDEGFWEDAEVVALNERLLAARQSTWFHIAPGAFEASWPARFDTALGEEARAILSRGFGAGPVEVVKDPRFCLTLPFWLALCHELGIAVTVCVASRSPLEVAASLQKRDGFAPGYGLRLYARYLGALQETLPEDSHYVTYPELLADTAAAVQPLLEAVGLPALAPEDASAAVKTQLRHQCLDSGPALLSTAPRGAFSVADFDAEVEHSYPLAATLGETVDTLVARGAELSKIGEAHSRALETIAAKDRDIEGLAAEYRDTTARLGEEMTRALATIDERDEQIREFDRRLADIGAQHSHALEVIADKDRQINEFKERIDRLCNLPVIGLAFRMAKQHARR